MLTRRQQVCQAGQRDASCGGGQAEVACEAQHLRCPEGQGGRVQGVGDTRRYLIPDSRNKIHGKPWKYKHSELYTISVDIKKEGSKEGHVDSQQRTATKKRN
jgi:hypothetical protein